MPSTATKEFRYIVCLWRRFGRSADILVRFARPIVNERTRMSALQFVVGPMPILARIATSNLHVALGFRWGFRLMLRHLVAAHRQNVRQTIRKT